jgi:hypothetical protein
MLVTTEMIRSTYILFLLTTDQTLDLPVKLQPISTEEVSDTEFYSQQISPGVQAFTVVYNCRIHPLFFWIWHIKSNVPEAYRHAYLSKLNNRWPWSSNKWRIYMCHLINTSFCLFLISRVQVPQ